MNVDSRAVMAAKNNADLYEAVFRAHQLCYKRLPHAFVAVDPPPPYYAHFTIQAVNCADDISRSYQEVSERFPGEAGMKDSFCQAHAEAKTLTELFGASWIWRQAQADVAPEGWAHVTTEADLLLWEQAWKDCGSPTDVRMFNTDFAGREDVFVLGKKVDGAFVTGCIANLSEDCVGLSNVFATGDKALAANEAVAAVAAIAPDVPMVGYESGSDLTRMLTLGFEDVGQLRVLLPAVSQS